MRHKKEPQRGGRTFGVQSARRTFSGQKQEFIQVYNIEGRRCYRTSQLTDVDWKKWLKPKRIWRRRRSNASSATLQQISTALLAKCLFANIIETTIRQELFHQNWLQRLCCCLLVVSFNWRGMDFPLLAACYSGSHHWPVFSLQGVQCWGNGKVCNKSKSKYSFYSDMCKCPMDTVHGTYHSAMTASNLCHMWRFILIYEKPLYVIFTSCLSVTLILVLMIWSFLTPKFRVLIAATDFEPGDFIFREKELVVRKDGFNNNLVLNIRFWFSCV